MCGRMAVTANTHFAERDPETGEIRYQCVVAFEDEAGYEVLNRGWHSLRKAQRYARSLNEANGLSQDDVLEVFTSALFESQLVPRRT